MNSLELVRQLYEGDIDINALENDLDEDMREELRHLIEAKDALASLPRRKPSPGVIDAVVAGSRRLEERRSTLTLILTNTTLQRLSAAAIVVVAIGVGYLTLRTDSFLPIEKEDVATMRSDMPRPAELQAGEDKDQVVADQLVGGEIVGQSKPESLPEPMREAPSVAFRQEADEMGAVPETERFESASRGNFAVTEESRRASRDDGMVFADAEIAPSDTAVLEESEILAWDQEDEALTTFFWQVQALDGRSPDEDWEEAVPLEGSFEYLEKQSPNDKRWLETGKQK